MALKPTKGFGRNPKIAALGKEVERLEKENERLKRRIAKLTTSTEGKPAKQLYFDEKDVAKRLGMSQKTLQNWRFKGEGPAFQKIGRSVRYRLRNIVAFEKRCREESLFAV